MTWIGTRPMRGTTPIHKVRAFVENGTKSMRAPREATVTPVQIGDTSGRWLDSPAVSTERVILYLHGGGFVMGWNNQYLGVLNYLSKVSDARILAIDYRLAPEHPFPAALDDCVAAYHWLLAEGYAPENIVIAGDSAGGNLTLTTMLTLRDAGEPLPAAGVCMSPPTDFTLSGDSYWQRSRLDPVLSMDFMLAVGHYYAVDEDPRNPLLSPLLADLRGLPPLLIHVGEHEMLLSDAQRFSAKAQLAGVDSTLHIWPRMWHVFQVFAPRLPEARQAINEIGFFVQMHCGKQRHQRTTPEWALAAL
jgi:acetyl esterase/lipase